MKTKLLIAVGIGMFIIQSCSSELTKEEESKKFLNSGQSYLEKKLASWDKEKRAGVESFILLKVDSIEMLNQRSFRKLDFIEAQNKYIKDLQFANEIADIDNMIGGISQSTKNLYTKADETQEKMNIMEERMYLSDTIKKLGSLVYFDVKLINEDGSTRKTNFPIAFNSDFTVNADFMDQMFK